MEKELASEDGNKTCKFEFNNASSEEHSLFVDAYLSQRCEESRKSLFSNIPEIERYSSLGLLDVDNISGFGDDEYNEAQDFKFLRSSSLGSSQLKIEENLNGSTENAKCKSDIVSTKLLPEIDTERVLAKKLLSDIDTCKNKESSVSLSKTFEFNETLLVDEEPFKTKESGAKFNKNLFKPNCSPNTPRVFNDELSSLGGDENDLTLCNNDVMKKNQAGKESNAKYLNTGNSQPSEQSNLCYKKIDFVDVAQDLTFESYSKDEMIKKFEEDEKKFILDKAAVLHNSQISQFSAEEDASGNVEKFDNDLKESIGQYFIKRSNRVSSFIKPTDDSACVFDSASRNLSSEMENNKVDCTLSADETLKLEQQIPTKCLMPNLEAFSNIMNLRKSSINSRESYASDSTARIQKIISEMGREISDTQITETLIRRFKSTNITDTDQKEIPKKVVIFDNSETPKTSKTQKRKEMNLKLKEKQKDDGSAKVSHFEYQILTPTSDVDSKENIPCSLIEKNLNVNEDIKIEAISKLKNRKAFDSSTPKFPRKKLENKNLKAINEDDWDVPSISLVHLANDIDEIFEDNDITLVNSGKTSKNSDTIINASILNIEKTILAGDLTMLSQKIDEAKEDSIGIIGSAEPEEPVILTVVQKLADFPKGSIDCTALLPLLQDKFPELLKIYSTPSKTNQSIFSNFSYVEEEDLLVTEPGSWVKLPSQIGYNEKINSLVDIQKSVSIPLLNVSKNWLILSLESTNLIQHNGKKSDCMKIVECSASDFITVIMKDTVIPPQSLHNFQVDFTSFIEAKLDLKLNISIKQLLGEETQTRSLFLRTTTFNTTKLLNILTEEIINFGFIGDECFDFRTVQISYCGISELPLIVYIEEKNPQFQFYSLKSVNTLKTDEKVKFDCKKFYYVFKEGEKQLLEIQILFQPEALLDPSKHQIFEASLIFQIATTTVTDGILKKIPMKSTVGVAKFYCNISSHPLVFIAKEKGQYIKKLFPVKNVGTLPIAFSLKLMSGENENEEEKEEIFTFAKSFFLSVNEESAIEITFQAKKPAKSLLMLRIEPNGIRQYKIHLIGEINLGEPRCGSPKSITSTSTKSIFTSESVHSQAKIVATTRSLTWATVPLDKEIKQTVQVKNESDLNLTARIYLQKNSNSFKFLNEDGEKVQKIRKVLKPHQPFTLTVIFRPDFVGEHHNAIILETVELGTKKIKKFSLSGIGGAFAINILNVKTDLSGCKMIFLQNSTLNIKNYCNSLLFQNVGPFPGFVVISANPTHSVINELNINPTNFIIDSEKSFEVRLTQKLKSTDIHSLLSGRDICKLASLSIVMGDELSRLRLKELVESGKVQIPPTCTKLFISTFLNEKKVNLKKFDDSQSFVKQFFKSLVMMEIAIAIEKSSETTLLLDEDSVSLFETICTIAENPHFSKNNEEKVSTKSSSQQTNEKLDSNNSLLSSSSSPLKKKIFEWLNNTEMV